MGTLRRARSRAKAKTANAKTANAKTANAKPVLRRLRKARSGAARQAAYRTYAAELLENVRQRYEETPEPIPLLAADLGILPCNFYRLAKGKGWVRRNDLPPRAMSSALRILEEAKVLAVGAAGPVDAAGVVGGSREGSEAPPTPDPSPPFAARMGGGERAAFATLLPASSEAPTPPAPSTVERLERAVLAELATVEAMRAALGTMPQKPPGARETVRTLSMLTQTLQIIQRLRASAVLEQQNNTKDDRHDDDDDLPADIDEFRRELARRIDAFVASRTGGDGGRADASGEAVDAAAS